MLQYEKVRGSALFINAKKYWLDKLDNYNFEMALPLAANISEIDKPKFARITKTIPQTIWK